MNRWSVSYLMFLFAVSAAPAWATNGGTLYVNPENGWKAFEVITEGNIVTGWTMPDAFDGLGAWLPDANTLRVEINHEISDATVSEVNLNRANFQTAIRDVINSNSTGGVIFVTSAQQAYDSWSANGGSSFTATTSNSNTTFYRFCSGQSYAPNAFGAGRGFVDNIYITGEEAFATTGRLFAIDLANRDFYQLSGVAGPAGGGNNGMPADSFENAALLDTGDVDHVALLLSPDGGTSTMRLYVGVKGVDAAHAASSSFLARNGLAYGHFYYLNGTFPATTATPPTTGSFSTSSGTLTIAKLEDVDTNPNNGTQVVQGIQETGLFTYDFNLAFGGETLDTTTSSFSLKKIQGQANDTDGSFGDADNVDWTAATTLNGVSYPNGLIFVNEDSLTANGETWMMTPDGSGLTRIANTIGTAGSETSGILDISSMVGYKPGSILLTSNQGVGSLTVLIHPNAALAGDFNSDGKVNAADYVSWRAGVGTTYMEDDYFTWREQFGQTPGSLSGDGAALDGAEPVPEPTGIALALMAGLVLCVRFTY